MLWNRTGTSQIHCGKCLCDEPIFSELEQSVDIVHDSHFLTEAEDRELYLKNMHRALKTGGHFIIGTFVLPDGPLQCSGIPIARYNEESLKQQMSKYFVFIESSHEMHKTPFDTAQHFIFCHFIKKELSS